MKTFFKGITKGFTDFGPAISFIFKHNLAWFYLLPIVLNILLFMGSWTAISAFSDYLQQLISDAVSITNASFCCADLIMWIVNTSISLILHVLMFFVFAYTGGYIVVIILSPVLAYISEKTEKIITGNQYPFNPQQLMRDVIRGALIAMRNLGFELLIMLIFFIFSFVPFVGWLVALISPFALFFVAAYFYGFSFVDYVSERRKYNVKESVQFVKQKRGLVIGNGMPFALVILVPYLGLLLSGFVAITSTVAAVISITDPDINESNKQLTIDE